LLDARDEAEEALEDSVWIPFAQLSDRIHELPEKDIPFRVVGPEAMEWLHDTGFRATLEEAPVSGARGRSRLWRPNAFLESVSMELRPGTAMDLGSGSGRDATFLASEGHSVFAVDRLDDALDRVHQMAKIYAPGMHVRTAVLNLEEQTPMGGYDLITNFFFFDLEMLRRAKDLLHPGGSLVIEAFSHESFELTGRPSNPRRRMGDIDLSILAGGMEIVRKQRSEKGTIQVWLRRI
jgi:SAM-dependent methyltransferase